MRSLIAVIFILSISLTTAAQTTEFSYQGRLLDASSLPTDGSFDLRFSLFDSASGGTQLGPTLERLNVSVASGIFSVKLDFGDQFDGTDRFLEISVREHDPTNTALYSALSPRQTFLSTPYAIKARLADEAANAVNADNATTADSAANADLLDGKDSTAFVMTTDPRLENERPPTEGSEHYIQNRSAEQPSSSFHISGFGTAEAFRARYCYTINTGTSCVLRSPPTTRSLFVGFGSRINSTGADNVFVGNNAGANNTSGDLNVFVGEGTGFDNTTGRRNAFIGTGVGANNISGVQNTFLGTVAGLNNIDGDNNVFLGDSAGYLNKSGSRNVFIGFRAGFNNTAGNNVFIGHQAGDSNTIGQENTFVGTSAGSNNATTSGNSFFGFEAGLDNVTGSGNSFFGREAGRNTTGRANSFFGNRAGRANTSGIFNTAIGSGADFSSGSLQFATAIGANSTVSSDNTIAMGRTGGFDKVLVYGKLEVDGRLELNSLGSSGGTQLCRNLSNQISNCSSSLRYKTNIAPFTAGLSLLNKLRPITFNWKQGGMNDLGFGAEDVAEIEPLLITYNEKGQVEGVKYDRVGVVLVNAVKEQQQMIEQQKQQILSQQRQIDALVRLVCASTPDADLCRGVREEK